MDVVERSLEVARPVEAVWALLATPAALGDLVGRCDGRRGAARCQGHVPRRRRGHAAPRDDRYRRRARELRFIWWYDGADRGLVTVRVEAVDGGAVVRVREQRVGHRSLLGLRATA